MISDRELVHGDLVEQYQRDGVVVLRRMYGGDEIDAVRKVVYRLYRKIFADDAALDRLEAPWDSEAFDRKLHGLRETDRPAFGALYDAAQNSVETIRLLTAPKALEAAAKLLRDEPGNLAYSGLLLRMDAPGDTRNVLGWHQDRAYFSQNFDGHNGVVMSVLLNDTDETLGALRLCPGSHREGFLPLVQHEKRDGFSTEQRGIDPKCVEKYPELVMEGRKGDVLFFDMNMFHRSGANRSSRIRYSAILRFHRMLADDYVPFRSGAEYNKWVLEQVEKRFAS